METELLQALGRLNPSNQRLIRELVWKLAQLDQLTIPEQYDAALEYTSQLVNWLTYLVTAGRSPYTISHYRRYVERLLQEHPHPTRVHLEAFLARTVASGRQPATVAIIAYAVKSFFGYLADTEVITNNPAAKLSRPRVPLRTRQAPTPEQVTSLLAAPKNQRHQFMLLLMVDCGLRVSEVASVEVDNIDLSHKVLRVVGKGSKERYVPFSDITAMAIDDQLSCLEAAAYAGPWLFPGRYPSQHASSRAIEAYLAQLCSHQGMAKITPHHLRHYFATMMLSHGASLKATSAMLGHARASTTTDIYWHIIDQKEIAEQHEKYSPVKLSTKGVEVSFSMFRGEGL